MNARKGRVYEIKVIRSLGVNEDLPDATKLDRGDKVADLFRAYVSTAQWFDPDKECVIVFVLNRKNVLIGYNLVSLGSVSSSIVSPREVLRPVIVAAGSAFIIAHNHPSGDPAPSTGDLQITRLIRDAAKTVNISFLDHIIVGDVAGDPTGKGFYSFRDSGMI